MANPKPDEGINYVSTTNLAMFFFWCLEGSIVQFCRRDMGFRFNSPRKMTYGLVAGLLCALLQEGSRQGYEHGASVVFLMVYCLVGAIQQNLQRKRLRQGIEIHSYSSGTPALADVFKHAGFKTLRILEVVTLLVLAAGCESQRIPLSLWLLLSAAALVVRGAVDDFAQQLADADAVDACLDAEELSRKLRERRGGAF